MEELEYPLLLLLVKQSFSMVVRTGYTKNLRFDHYADVFDFGRWLLYLKGSNNFI